jgi:SMI1 / KNR4 family (SUKH-1)
MYLRSIFIYKYLKNPVQDLDIIELEKQLSFTIPDDYKILLKISDGKLVPHKSAIIFQNHWINSISQFLGIERILFAYKTMLDIEKEHHYFFTDKLFPIAETVSSAFICMGYDTENMGKIFYIDYQDWNGVNVESTIKYLSPSINSFLMSLEDESNFI